MDFNFAKNVPEYLDEKYFDKVIRHIEKDPNAKVSNFDIVPGSAPGQNFGSALFRGKFTFKSKYSKDEKTISVIIKTKPIFGPEMAEWADTLKNSPLFRTEMEVYSKILPEMQSILLSAGDKDVISPKLLYQSNDPSSVIILEDVSVHGYSVIKRPSEDFEVSRKIVQRLAKFHAAGFFLLSENKFDPADFDECIYKDPAAADMLAGKSLAIFAEVLKEWEGCEKYAERFEVFKTEYLSRVLKTYAINKSEFGYNVLNHADFHINNLLFKKNSDYKIEELMFIDFQLCKVASPAIDLFYALYWQLSVENRQTRRDEFINSYYTQFVTSLKDFGYMKAPPSLIDLQVELLKNGNLEVLLGVCHSAMFYFDITKMTPEDMDQGEGSKRFLKGIFNNPDFKKMILHELPRYFYNGFI